MNFFTYREKKSSLKIPPRAIYSKFCLKKISIDFALICNFAIQIKLIVIQNEQFSNELVEKKLYKNILKFLNKYYFIEFGLSAQTQRTRELLACIKSSFFLLQATYNLFTYVKNIILGVKVKN